VKAIKTMAKILIIDDDVNTTWLMDGYFSKMGYEIRSVNNSNLAVSETDVFQPNLVIIDLMMPGIDGIEICKVLKCSQTTKDIPVLIFSAVGDVNAKVRAFEAGAHDFVTKPIHLEEIKIRIKNILKDK
jgi:DNA-binding response OmpR family regulator